MAETLNGILIVDKPAGITSMDAVSKVRRSAGGARTGHAGTLDPLATGVLVMAIGRATAAINQFMATDKRYRTEIDLSAFATTDDAEGERHEIAAEAPSLEEIRAALPHFIGEFLQRPPAFSAVKVAGRRAYSLARRGEPPQIAERPVVVHSLELLRYDWPIVELDIHCGKGFYVRSLARDLGETLGTGGHCASIRRTAVGPFTLEMSRSLKSLPAMIDQGDLMPLNQALAMVDRGEMNGEESTA
jgi:tRNA pseudouridine55 synthase